MMKPRPHPSAMGTGSHSRQAARFFLSREWLDRPLSAATLPARPPLAFRLGVALTGKAVAP